MRRVAALSALLGLRALAGCAKGDDDGGSVSPIFDAQPDVVALDTAVAETADSAIADVVAETAVDVADTSVADTFVADTFVADTFVADTFAPDTSVADTGPVDAGPPWTRTVAIDGVNDFSVAQEKFTTTSAGYDAYVTWDADFVYVGYTGADIGSTASAEKWLFVYIDVDPGTTTGPSSAERYNTQAPKFPTGFGAEYSMRWRTDNLDSAIKKWDGSSWAFVTTTPSRAKLGGFVELKIPRATLGTTTSFGLVTFMLNEKAGGEWTYAGLYGDNFVDGYSTAKPLTKYLLVDTTSPAPPNATSRIKP